MEEISPLTAWETFYVIVGSSGAALTGLQFVVIALVAESPVTYLAVERIGQARKESDPGSSSVRLDG